MTIRPATKDDIPALCRLIQLVQDLHAEAHPAIFKPHLDPAGASAFFAGVLADERNLVLVAEDGDKALGYIWCQEHVHGESFYRQAAHTAYIHHISVDPEQRRHGNGRRLAEAAIAALNARGAIRIGVDYWSFNEPARTFFEAMGFAPQRAILSLEMK